MKPQLDLKDLDKLQKDMQAIRDEILREGFNRGIRAATKAFAQSMIPAYRTAGHKWAYEAETEYREKLQKLLKPKKK